jgi:hypothetical protein
MPRSQGSRQFQNKDLPTVSAFALRLAGAALVLAAAPAAAADPAAAPTANTMAEAGGSATKAKNAKKDDDLICKTFPSTESRMKKDRVCRTREQWKKSDYSVNY